MHASRNTHGDLTTPSNPFYVDKSLANEFIDVSRFDQQFRSNRPTRKEKEPIKSDYRTGRGERTRLAALFPEDQDLTPVKVSRGLFPHLEESPVEMLVTTISLKKRNSLPHNNPGHL